MGSTSIDVDGALVVVVDAGRVVADDGSGPVVTETTGTVVDEAPVVVVDPASVVDVASVWAGEGVVGLVVVVARDDHEGDDPEDYGDRTGSQSDQGARLVPPASWRRFVLRLVLTAGPGPRPSEPAAAARWGGRHDLRWVGRTLIAHRARTLARGIPAPTAAPCGRGAGRRDIGVFREGQVAT